MSHLARFLRRTGRERLIIAVAATLILSLRVVIRLLPFASIRRLIVNRELRLRRVLPAAPIDETVRCIETATRHLPGTKCLAQTLAGRILFAFSGIATRVHLGVGRDDAGELAFHAWLEHDGHGILGELPSIETFMRQVKP